MNLRNREDRVKEYLLPHLNNYVFDELSPEYLQKNGLDQVLGNVQIPIKTEDVTKGLNSVVMGLNMSFVMGCDPDFQYSDNYVEYIHKELDPIFMKNYQRPFVEFVINEGIKATDAKDFDCACIYFRGALMLDEHQQDALYCYARACKDSYELGDEEEYVARYKAEALEAFERLTMESPEFAEGFYFLGYAYLNLGLYIKAKLTWEEFMKLNKEPELKKEIQERLEALIQPVEIEQAYNLIISGKYVEGYEKLSEYKEGKFKDWWPLWYYLGIAAKELGKKDESIEDLKKVLKLSPSNIEVMRELIDIYEKDNDKEMVVKYQDKIKVIEENILKDSEIKELGEKHGVTVATSLDELPENKSRGGKLS